MGDKKQFSLVDFASRLLNTPIALDAKTLDALIAAFLHNQDLVGDKDGLVDLSSFFFFLDDEPPLKADISENGIATINIVGPLSKDDFFGTQYGEIRNVIDAALKNDDVEKILLNFDSPGGTVNGMFELADYIYTLRGGDKPIWSVVNDMAASAAYALASATSNVLITETGTVGSVGVVARHVDVSKNNEARGVKITHIFAGDRKIDGSRDIPLSKEAKDSIQSDVDVIYDKLVERVSTHRSGMSAKAIRDTEGATYLGDAGVKIGFADGMTTAVGAVEEFLKSKVSASSVSVSAKGGDTERDTDMSKSEEDKAAEAAAEAARKVTPSAEVVNIEDARSEAAATARKAERDERKNYVSQVKSLCALAGCPERAIDFIESDTELSAIQQTLLDEKTAAAEEETEEVSGHQKASSGFTPRKIDPAAIYRKRRETVAAYQGQTKFE